MVGSIGRGASSCTLVDSLVDGVVITADVALLVLVSRTTTLLLIMLLPLGLSNTLSALLANVIDPRAHCLVESEFRNGDVLLAKAAFLGFNVLLNFLFVDAAGHWLA